MSTTKILVMGGVVVGVGAIAYIVATRGTQRSFPTAAVQPVQGRPAASATDLGIALANFGGRLISTFRSTSPTVTSSTETIPSWGDSGFTG